MKLLTRLKEAPAYSLYERIYDNTSVHGELINNQTWQACNSILQKNTTIQVVFLSQRNRDLQRQIRLQSVIPHSN